MDEKQELIEIYKLHAELADSVSKQQGTANRFYMLVLSGLAVLFSAFLQRENGVLIGWLMIGFGLFGMLLASAWYIVIRSYRQLNSGKFKALHELEEKLAYPFFKREWDLLAEGREQKTYWRLTVVETFVPTIFCLFYGVTDNWHLPIGNLLIPSHSVWLQSLEGQVKQAALAQQQEAQARQHAESKLAKALSALERLQQKTDA